MGTTKDKPRLVRKTSKAMDSYLKAGQAAGRLLPSLQQFLLTEDPEFRSQAILHPSAMSKTDWCPASGYWQLKFDDEGLTPPQERNALQRQNIFDEGHYIHDKWQQRFWRQGKLYGKYRCIACNHEWWATAPLFCASLTCQKPRKFLQYREITLNSGDRYRIGGHADGWIKDDRPDCLIEIKSVGLGTYRYDAKKLVERYGEDADALWKNTKRPFSSHVRQGQIYLRLCHLMFGDDAPKSIDYIYEYKVNQQYKEFDVEYDPVVTDEIFADAEDIVDRLAAGEGPPPCFRGRGETCPQCGPYLEQKQ